MKQLFLAVVACLISIPGFATKSNGPLQIEIESYSEPSTTGLIEVRMTYILTENSFLTNDLEPELPDNWAVDDWGESIEGSYVAGSEISRTLLVSHPTSALPFYPEKLSFGYLANEGYPVHAEVRVYFTPWDEVEIWSYGDFVRLPRNWYVDRDENATRIYVDPATIPESDIPENYDPQEDWEEDFQTVHVPGLAYSIPMLPIHPDSLVDTTNIVIVDSNGRYDGCGLNWRRYQGTISGTILSPFRDDDITGGTDFPFEDRALEGLRVELWEEDAFADIRIGYGTTDHKGNFSFYVNTCQLWEGGELEIYLKIEARNYSYKIKGKNTWVFGSTQIEETNVQDWNYNNGDSSAVDFDTLVIDNGAHRAVSMCVQSWNYTNMYSGITLDKALTVRADLSAGSFFLPDKICGVPITVVANAGWLVPKIGIILGPIGTAYFVSDIIFNTQKPNIFLRQDACQFENTPRHEFGHFVMWQLQNKCWTDPLSGSFATHRRDTISNTRIAWTEGWADAFSMIIDAHHREWDGESGTYTNRSFEDRVFESDITFGPGSEYHVGLALFDVWDGQDKYLHLTNGAPTHADANTLADPEWWQNGQTDEVSTSFEDMCDIIAAGDPYSPNNKLQSIQGFYKALLEGKSCWERARIKRVFDQNRVVETPANFPNGVFRGFSSDEIAASNSHPYSGSIQGINWSYNFIHEYDATFLWTSGQDYNLATTTVNGYQFLSDDLTVKDGATLHFNRNIPVKWVSANSPVRPALNSTMEADLCGDMTLQVIQDGHIIVGDQAVTAHADVKLNSGSTLILGGNSASNTGQLQINNNSRFYVEEGAELIIEQGAEIFLNGNDAVLEIDGDLTIRPGATFTFTGSGHVVFGNDFWNQTVNTSSTSKIDLEGSGQSDLILIVKDNCHWWNTGPIAEFDISNGRVELGANSNILVNGSSMRLQNIDVTSHNGGRHTGIMTTGQANHIISNADFSHGQYGLRAYQIWGSGGVVQLTNCDFDDVDQGLVVHAGASRLINCSFTSCSNTGYTQELAAFNSYLNSSDFMDNGTGINYKTGSGDLILSNCNVNENYTGVRMDGPGTLRGKCSLIDNNDTYGILALSGAFIDLSDNVDGAGSQFKIRGNGSYSMYSFVGAGVNFFHGSNDFVPALENNNRVLAGAVLGPCASPTIIDAERNHWNTRTTDPKGDVPISNTDYLVWVVDQWPLFNCIQNFTMTDPMRYEPSPYCSYGPIGGGTGGGVATANPLRECSSCRTISTSQFENMAINEAVLTAMEAMEEFNTEGSNTEALAIFDEILSNDLENLTWEERYVVDVALEMGHSAFANAAADGQVSFENWNDATLRDPNVTAALHLLDIKADLLGDSPAKEIVAMEKAMIDHLGQQFATASNQLTALQENETTGLEPWMDYASCYMDAEQGLLDGTLTWDEFEAQVAYCTSSKTDPIWDAGLEDGLRAMGISPAANSSFEAHPNPSNGRAIATLKGNFEGAVSWRIFDVQGKAVQVDAELLPASPGEARCFFDTSTLPSGLYFVEAMSGSNRYTEKLIVR